MGVVGYRDFWNARDLSGRVERVRSFRGTAPSFGVFRNELLFVPVFLVIVFLPINGPIGEELGWRGYLLPAFSPVGWDR